MSHWREIPDTSKALFLTWVVTLVLFLATVVRMNQLQDEKDAQGDALLEFASVYEHCTDVHYPNEGCAATLDSCLNWFLWVNQTFFKNATTVIQ